MNMRKIISLLLTTALLFTMMPYTVIAEDSTADLTISTADELKDFAQAVNNGDSYEGKTVVLSNNIDMEYTAVVIGTKANPFKGAFDGQGYTVSNITIYEDGSDSDYFADSDDCLGLFGVINSPAIVKNVTVENPFIVGSAYVAGIVGIAYTGTVENCHVIGEIDIEGVYMVGGITGHGYAAISNCSVIGKEGWDYNYIGATYKEADLEGDNVGGIVGHKAENTDITNCTVKNVTVEGTRKIGGIVGTSFQNNDITDCVVDNVTVSTNASAEYASGNASSMGIGGIVGLTSGTYTGGSITGKVSNITFNVENEGVTVSAGAVTGGHRGTTYPVVPESTDISVSVASIKGATNTYGISATEATVATEEELVAALANGGEIKLTSDITTTAALTTSGITAVIDLNGNTLTIGAGDNKFNDATNLTIKNGTINIDNVVANGNAIFCLDEYEETLVTTLTLEDVELTGENYSSAYGVFYIGDSSVLNVIGGEWTLTNDLFAAGGVFKADDAKATLNIDGTEMTLHNVRRVVTYANTTIENATIAISGDEDGVDAEMEHGFNHSPLTVVNSTITMENMVGRGITAQCGAVSISDNSTVTMTNCQEATIDVRGGQTVTVDSTSTVTLDAAPTITSGTIDGTVTVSPTGTVTTAYAKEVDGYVRIWGEATANATESFVLELYSGETLIATTSLNDVGNIIDGDIDTLTWNFYYPESNDEYWTTVWEEGHPRADFEPTKVVLYSDGTAVAENVAKMTSPDDIHDVVWSELGGVSKAPNATVSKLDPLTLTAAEHDYMVWPSGDDTIDRPLDIVMNFKANDTLEVAKASAFGKYKTDFYITLDGLESDSITADNCYLAGNYGSYGWIVIPTDGLVLEESIAYPVVSAYDANLTYENICDYVKEFTAAIHIAPEILEANPNMTVTLDLRMTNPSDESDVITVGGYTYDAEDFGIGADEKPVDTRLEMVDTYAYKEPIIAFGTDNTELYRVAMIAAFDTSLALEWYTGNNAYTMGFEVTVDGTTQTVAVPSFYANVTIEGNVFALPSGKYSQIVEVLAFGKEYADKTITIQAYMTLKDGSTVYSEPTEVSFTESR